MRMPIENTVSEEWTPVTNYEGLYWVSNHGNIKSLGRWTKYAQGHTRYHKGKLLSPVKNQSGHLIVRLTDNNKVTKAYQVHRLVASHFVDGWFEGAVVNHLDSDPSNNHHANLEWTTCSGNVQHALVNGNMPKGEDSYKAILTEIDVLFARHWRETTSCTIQELANMFGISWGGMQNILSKRSWKHV